MNPKDSGGVKLPSYTGGGGFPTERPETAISGAGLPLGPSNSGEDVLIGISGHRFPRMDGSGPSATTIQKYMDGVFLHTGGSSAELVPLTVQVPADRKEEWELFFALCLTMMQAREQPK